MKNLHRVTIQCGIVSFTSGSLIGFSTVLESLNKALTPSTGTNLFNSSHGANAYGLAFVLSGICTLIINRFGRGRPSIVWTLLAFSSLSFAISIVFCAVADSTRAVAVLYLCAVPFMALGLAGTIYSNNVVAVGQWVKHGRPEVGAAVIGFSQGIGTLAFTVTPGLLIEADETWGLYYYSLILCVFGLLGTGLAVGGWFKWPPDDDPEEEMSKAVPDVQPNALASSSLSPDSKGTNAEGDKQQMHTQNVMKNNVSSATEFLLTMDGFMYSSLYVGVYFAGIGAKGVLTAMYLLIFPDQLTFLEATVLATVSLVAYAIIRSFFPFLTKVVPINLTFGAVVLTGALLFGILPWLLKNSLNEIGFTAIMAVTGAVYAIGATLLPLVGALYFEANLFPLAAGTASALLPYGAAAGITMSWYLAQGNGQHQDPTHGNSSSTSVFNRTFYMFVVVYTLNAFILCYFFYRGKSCLSYKQSTEAGIECGKSRAASGAQDLMVAISLPQDVNIRDVVQGNSNTLEAIMPHLQSISSVMLSIRSAGPNTLSTYTSKEAHNTALF